LSSIRSEPPGRAPRFVAKLLERRRSTTYTYYGLESGYDGWQSDLSSRLSRAMQLSLISYHSFVLNLNLLWLLCTYNYFRECHSFVASTHKRSTRVVETKYGPLQGIYIQNLQVEAYLGVPYATPPLESLRFMPPVTPSLWTQIRMADTFSAVCPQKLPDISNRTEALLQIPRGRLVYLEKLLPLLANQSEDCLYLNIYVPKNISEYCT
jgi:hypothetical protein